MKKIAARKLSKRRLILVIPEATSRFTYISFNTSDYYYYGKEYVDLTFSIVMTTLVILLAVAVLGFYIALRPSTDLERDIRAVKAYLLKFGKGLAYIGVGLAIFAFTIDDKWMAITGLIMAVVGLLLKDLKEVDSDALPSLQH